MRAEKRISNLIYKFKKSNLKRHLNIYILASVTGELGRVPYADVSVSGDRSNCW